MVDTESRFYSRAFALVAIGLLGLALFRIVTPLLPSFLWAALLAVVLGPLNARMRRGLGQRRGTAALLLTLGLTLLVLLPVGLLTVVFARQAAELARRIQVLAEEHHVAQLGDVLSLPGIDRLVRWSETTLPISADRIQGWLVETTQGLLRHLVSLSGAAFAGALGAAIGFLLTLFLLFFFLRDGDEMMERLLRFVPMSEARKAHLVEHLASVTQAVVIGVLLTAAVQGTLLGIGFAIIGFPSPVVFGVLAAGAALVPVVGAALMWLPALVVLATQGRWGAMIFLTLWSVLLVSQADNVVRPLVISGRGGISMLPVFVGLLGGIVAFGPIGMFVGPVIIALALSLLRFAEESRTAG